MDPVPSQKPENFIRLTKQEKKRLKYQASKEKKRQMKKKAVLKKKQVRAELLCSMTEDERRAFIVQEKLALSLKQQELQRAYTEGIKVLLDLSYYESMTEIEKNSLVKQITEAVGYLRKSEKVHLKLVCINTCEELKKRLENEGSKKWLLEVSEDDIEKFVDDEQVFMLSPDAGEVLDEVNKNSVYVVGGLVDRTIRKSQTLTRALSKGIKAVRLPVQDYIKVVSDM